MKQAFAEHYCNYHKQKCKKGLNLKLPHLKDSNISYLSRTHLRTIKSFAAKFVFKILLYESFNFY